VRGFLLDPTRTDELEGYEADKREMAELFAQVDVLVVTEKGKEMVASLKEQVAGYEKMMDELVHLARSGNSRESVVQLFSPERKAARQQLMKSLDNLVARGRELEKKLRDDQTAAESSAVRVFLVLSIVGLAVGSLMAFYISRNIGNSVSQLMNMIEEVSNNDLSGMNMSITSEDELGNAARALNQMKDNLRSVIQSIAGTAEHVASASEEISSSASQ